MTDPQLNAANTGHASLDIRFESSWLFIIPVDGWIDSCARARQTLAKTIIQIRPHLPQSWEKLTENDDLFANRGNIAPLRPPPED